MCVPQWKLRVARMIEQHFRPGAGAMTLRTFRAVDPVVRIVARVTVMALRRLSDFKFVARVAGIAVDSGVPAGQGKAGTLEVIEQAIRPLGALMAVAAFATVIAHVRVILGMTSIAIGRCIDIGLRDMTADAIERTMRPGQREAAACRMIVGCIRPGCFTVTIRACCAEIAHMPIVARVAIIALCARHFVERLRGVVAIVADRFPVTVV